MLLARTRPKILQPVVTSLFSQPVKALRTTAYSHHLLVSLVPHAYLSLSLSAISFLAANTNSTQKPTGSRFSDLRPLLAHTLSHCASHPYPAVSVSLCQVLPLFSFSQTHAEPLNLSPRSRIARQALPQPPQKKVETAPYTCLGVGIEHFRSQQQFVDVRGAVDC